MRPIRVRMLGAVALAVIALVVPVTRVDAAGGLGSCPLRPSEGTGPDNLGAMLEAVDVLAPNDAWAVGTFTGDFPLVEHWNGRAWSLVHVPVMVGTEQILTSVDGTGPDDLWVAGEIRDAQQQMHGLVLHHTSDGWHVVPAPAGSAVLQGVTMVDGLPAVAGWSIDPDGYARGLVATGTTDGGWSNADLGPSGGENTFLMSVSVDPSGVMWAVGFSNTSPDDDTVRTFRFDGTSWTAVQVPEQPGPSRVLDVSSDDAGTVAVGQTITDGATHALVLRFDDGAWSVMPSDSGSDAPDTLSGTSVWNADVWAVGRTVVTGATYGIPAARVYSCG